jgi:hypothetical protein
MHKGELATLLRDDFVVVKVDIGRHDKNLELAREYKVPLEEGIPALAILDSSGRKLYSMQQGQFADARNMSYDSIKGFFEQWKPRR